MFETIYMNALVFLGPALLMLLGWVAFKVKTFIDQKIGNEALKGILDRLTDATETAVKGVFQAFVEPLKNGGNFSDSDKAIAKQMAIAEIKSHLGEKGVKELMTILGWNQETVDSNLATKVEAKVADLKKE
jgi:uncharacterized protein YidB (DUF937 family)